MLSILGSSCAPVEFTSPKLEVKPEEVINQDKENKEKETEEPKAPHSVFYQYLSGEIELEYMLAWIFSDAENFRGRIYDMTLEAINFSSMTELEQLRVLSLEYELNQIIKQFNQKNIFDRTFKILYAGLEKSLRKENYTMSVSPDYLRSNGLDAISLSDSTIGLLNSVVQNGFTADEVDLLCRKKCAVEKIIKKN